MSALALARRRKAIPRVELLESRSLLSALSISLTTNQSVYQAGQPIQMTFTETNTSSQPVTVAEGPSIDGFDVTQNGNPVWQSNAGINPLFLLADPLQPGQSLTLKQTWDGVPGPVDQPILPGGTYSVTNQLDPHGASATFQIESSSPSDPSPPSPTSPPHNQPPVSVSLTTKRQQYRTGETVVMTLTLKNTSSQSVAIPPGSTSDGFSVLAGSTAIWHSAGNTRAATARTLSPGESIAFHAAWNSKSSRRGANPLARVLDTVEASAGGYSAATTI